MEEIRFLYSVYPKKPIKGILENGRVINSGKSLNLTIDQVKACMQCGTVYRWFANENRIERVTSANMERLHNEKFMTEDEYEAFKFNGVAGSTGSVVEVVPIPTEEQKVETVIAPKVEPVAEVKETVEVVPAVAVEEPVETVSAAEEAPVEAVEEKIEEAEETPVEKTEETVEETVASEEVEENKPAETPNYQNYKKKKH